MNFDLFLILIVSPFIIGSIFLVVSQGKFFDRYHAVFHPKEPISMVDFGQLLQRDPLKGFIFIKNNFVNFFFFGWRIYFRKYDDIKLKRYAFLVKLIFCVLIIIPLLGLIMALTV